MTTRPQAELYRAAAQTFEDLSFLLPGPDEELAPPAECAASVASVEFDGPFAGRLEVAATDSLLTVVAGNMLGEDDVSDLQRFDALMEVANVVCGNLLPMLAGHERVFRIQAPQVRDAGAPSGAATEPAAACTIAMEEGWARVALFVEDDAVRCQEYPG